MKKKRTSLSEQIKIGIRRNREIIIDIEFNQISFRIYSSERLFESKADVELYHK